MLPESSYRLLGLPKGWQRPTSIIDFIVDLGISFNVWSHRYDVRCLLVVWQSHIMCFASHVSIIHLSVVNSVSITILAPCCNNLVYLLLTHQFFLLFDIWFLKRLQLLLEVKTRSLRLLGEIHVIDRNRIIDLDCIAWGLWVPIRCLWLCCVVGTRITSTGRPSIAHYASKAIWVSSKVRRLVWAGAKSSIHSIISMRSGKLL